MMFCINCGADVTNMRYCPQCGKPVMNDYNKGWADGNAVEDVSGSSDYSQDKLCRAMGNSSYESVGKGWCIAKLVVQGLSELLFNLSPDLNMIIVGILLLRVMSLFFLVMDWRCLSKQGVRGAWKIWGVFLFPVYLLIRAKKTDRKYGMAVISFLIVSLGFWLAFWQGFWRGFSTSFWREMEAGGFLGKQGSIEEDKELSSKEDEELSVEEDAESSLEEDNLVRKLVRVNFYDGNGSISSWEEYSYDSAGNQTKEVWYEADGTMASWSEYSYDGTGNLTTDVRYVADGIVGEWTEYSYDSAGNQTKQVVYDGYYDFGAIKWWEEYSYDSAGNKTKEVSYDADGKISDWSEYGYDSTGNLTEDISYFYDGTIFMRHENSYNNAGNKTKEVSYDADGTKIGWTEYIYE